MRISRYFAFKCLGYLSKSPIFLSIQSLVCRIIGSLDIESSAHARMRTCDTCECRFGQTAPAPEIVYWPTGQLPLLSQNINYGMTRRRTIDSEANSGLRTDINVICHFRFHCVAALVPVLLDELLHTFGCWRLILIDSPLTFQMNRRVFFISISAIASTGSTSERSQISWFTLIHLFEMPLK